LSIPDFWGIFVPKEFLASPGIFWHPQDFLGGLWTFSGFSRDFLPCPGFFPSSWGFFGVSRDFFLASPRIFSTSSGILLHPQRFFGHFEGLLGNFKGCFDIPVDFLAFPGFFMPSLGIFQHP